MQLDQCAQIAASLPLLGVEEGARVPQPEVHIVAAAAPLPLALRKLNVVPELASPPPAARPMPVALSVQRKIRYAAAVSVAALWQLKLLLPQHCRLLLPLERCLRRCCIHHLGLAAIAAHVRLVAGALHQLAHGAGLGHCIGNARRRYGIHKARLPGIYAGVERDDNKV